MILPVGGLFRNNFGNPDVYEILRSSAKCEVELTLLYTGPEYNQKHTRT